MGFFEKIKKGLSKTKKSIGNIFPAFRGVDDEFYDELEERMILADMGVDTAVKAVEAICRRFHEAGSDAVIPKDPKSACKRVCMFLRWMGRSNSPVDLGLWSSFLDRRTLVIPLDTHVLQEAKKLGLLKGSSASMCVARRLTAALAEVFPDDPTKGDFALFGAGVDA